MNNKGVTLIELLIVIVVLGIISAFAIPAVGGIISNTNKGGVYNDAIQIENAAKLYCQQETCTNGSTTLTWVQLTEYVSSFDEAYFEMTDGVGTDTAIAALQSDGTWQVTLEKEGAGTSATDEWEWVSSTPPSDGSKSLVTDD